MPPGGRRGKVEPLRLVRPLRRRAARCPARQHFGAAPAVHPFRCYPVGHPGAGHAGPAGTVAGGQRHGAPRPARRAAAFRRVPALNVGASNRATRLALFDPYALHVLPQLKQLNGRQVGADELDKARRSFDCMEDTLRKHASGAEEGATAGGHSDGAFAPAKADRFSKAAEDMLTSARLQACKTELLNSEWSAIIRSARSPRAPRRGPPCRPPPRASGPPRRP